MLRPRNARIAFILFFAIITFAGMQINFSRIVGSESQSFTLFQFFGPLPGALLGPVLGPFSVLLAEVSSAILLGKEPSLINLARLFPMLFAAVSFGTFLKKKDWKDVSVVVPALAILAFVLHPVGGQAWAYSMYWLIPIMAKLFSKRLFFRSLGATFTAHAVGSVIWLYTVPMTAGQWLMLIPIVAFERGLFATGISLSYLAFNTVLHKAESVLKTGKIRIEKNYIVSKRLLGFY